MRAIDDFGRPINYLRVSVTDRCNLRCVYCMPAEGVQQRDMSDILTFEEIETVVRTASEFGISKIRLTGGEPLARLGIVDLVGMLARVPGLDDLSMTTNGTQLADKAEALALAGLNRVNISLDTLKPDRFQYITRRGRLDNVLQGIKAAKSAGLKPVKINVVVVRGLNEDEVVDFARLTVDEGWHVRYIEMMPIGTDPTWRSDGHVPIHEIQTWITETIGPLQPAAMEQGGGPARYYRIAGSDTGTIGFISPVTEHFCDMCNRLRLTADGRLRPCLLSDVELDVRSILRSNANIEQIRESLKQAISLKPRQHCLEEHITPKGRAMSEIGG
jgi:cyclic pyranopterin phosphate synthase